MSSKSQPEGLKQAQEELSRIKAREKHRIEQAEEKIQKLEASVASLQTELAVARENETRLSQEKKKLVDAAKEARKKAKAVLEEMLHLQSRLPALEGLLEAADFLRKLPGQLRARLDDQGYALDDMGAFLCRCGNRDALVAIWQAARQMAINGEAPDATKEFLENMLFLYNQGVSQKLAAYAPETEAYATDQARAWWVVPFCEEWWQNPERVECVLLPGLLDAEGAMLVEPLLKLRHC